MNTVIARQFWWRHRWSLSSAAMILLLSQLLLACSIAPAEAQRYLAVYSIIAYGILTIYLTAILSFGIDANLSKPASGVPRYLMTLPIRSWQVVTWPLLLLTLCVVLIWTCGWVTLSFHLSSKSIPYTLPLIFILACAAWIQAATWAQTRSHVTRIVILILVMLFCFAIAFLTWSPTAVDHGIAWGIQLINLAAAVTSVVLAFRAARRGDTISLGFENLLPWLLSKSHWQATFETPSAALSWRFWRQRGWLYPLLVVSISIPLGVVIVVNGDNVAALVTLLLAFLWFHSILGVTLGGICASYEQSTRMPTYIRILPAANKTLVKNLFKDTTVAMLVGWCFSGLLLATTLVTAWRSESVQAELQNFDAIHGNGTSLVLVFACIIALFLLQASFTFSSLWIGSSGRDWFQSIFFVPIMLVMGGSIMCGCYEYAANPGVPLRFLKHLPTAIAIALAFKIIFTIVIIALTFPRLITAAQLLRHAVLFGIIATVLTGLFYSLLPAAIAHPWLIAVSVIVFTPFSSLHAVRRTIEWNRHR